MKKIDFSALELLTVPIADIKNYALNSREHPPEQVSMAATSIRRYGFNNPVLLAPDLTLVAGHCRVLAAKVVGLTEVPAIVLPHLNEAEQRAYRIADNAVSLKGSWSLDNLALEVGFLFDAKLDFDFDAVDLGFDTGELDALLSEPKAPKARAPSVREPNRTKPPVTQLGDLWIIAGHRIYCGDSTNPDSYVALLGSERADLVFSDMPYNVKVNGHVGGKGKVKHREFVMGSGEMSREGFNAFIRTALTHQANFSHPGAVNFQFCDWRMAGDMMAIGEDIYDSLLNVCVWVKQAGAMGSLWRSRHEFVLAFRVGSTQHLNNVQLGRMGRNRTNVWEYDSPTGFGSEREKLKLHPTCKNVEMLADAIMDVTKHKAIVLDAFLGSGSTALACEKTGRRCRGIELDAAYVDLALERLAEATGETPVNADGIAFDEIRALRSEDAA